MKKTQITILLFFLIFFGFFLIGDSRADEIIYRSSIGMNCGAMSCFTSDVYVQGDYAYLIGYAHQRLFIHDISDPDSIILAGTKETGSSGNMSIFVQGNYAYVIGNISNRLSIFDISDPSSIVTKASTSANLNHPKSLFVQGDYAYVASEYSSNLAIFDVSNPDSIVAKDSIFVDGFSGFAQGPVSVYVSGSYAYIASNTGNLYIYDISNPDSIVAKGSTADGLNKSSSVFVQGSYAYVTSRGNNRLAIFDISNPDSIVTKGFTNVGLSNPYFVKVQNDYAYVTNWSNNSLAIFDISNPDSIVSKCSDTTQLNGPVGLFVKGKYVYVASYNNSRLVIFEHPQATLPPTVDIKANGSDGPIAIDYNTSADLTWTSTDATFCLASGDWSGAKPLSGSESTGNLIASKTYTITCTGPGGSANDSVTVNINPPAIPTGDFNVFGWAWSDNIGWISFNYENCYPSGPPGCPPVVVSGYGVDIDADTGEMSGYAWSDNIGWISFNKGELGGCPAGTCEAILDKDTGEVSGWAKVLCSNSWILLSDRTNGFNRDDIYIDTATGDFHDYAWSDDYGWISFNCKEGGPGGADICGTSDYKVYTTFSFATDVFNLSNSFDNPCVQSRIPILSWETSDSPFDYELEIDGDTGTIQESGTIATTNGSWSPACQKCCNVAPYNDITFPNKTYNWRVKVKIGAGPWSEWKASTFTTFANCYPNPNFTLDPQDPIIGDEVQLCSTNIAPCLIRESVCYSVAGEIPCHTGGKNFLWDIPEIPANGSYLDGTTSTDFNPKIQLDVISDTYIILEITDTAIASGSGDCSDNRAGCCAIRKDITPGLPLPQWWEISPSN